MKILAFDLASKTTGVSVINNGKLLKKYCELIELNPKHSYGQRLQQFECEIKNKIRLHKPDICVIEDIYKGRSALVFKILSLFRGVAIKSIYDEMNKDPISIMASSSRSLLGIKNTKEDAFKFINQKYKLGFKFSTDNDKADAIVLGLACHEMLKQGLTEKDLRTKKKRKRRKKK